MKSLSRVRGGHKARKEGNQFESILELQCKLQGVYPEKIKTFARFIVNLKKWIPVKSPFDYVLWWNKRACALDCKTIAGKSFKKVQGNMVLIKPHQIKSLTAIEHTGSRAGILAWYRNQNIVIFFDASIIERLSDDDPITPDLGEYIGTFEDFCLGNLFP